MAMFTQHPETLRDRINAIPIERIREHIRASAWSHWGEDKDEESKAELAIIADGRDMREALLSFATPDEFHFYAAQIGFKPTVIARCVSCIRAADKAAGKQNVDPNMRFYNAEARKRMKQRNKNSHVASVRLEKGGDA